MNKEVVPRFVDVFPDALEEGVLYISLRFNTAVHLCACGCGMKTITKIAPGEWRMIYNGKEISLLPSIGNWNFECRSHYWIRNNKFVFIKEKADYNEGKLFEKKRLKKNKRRFWIFKNRKKGD